MYRVNDEKTREIFEVLVANDKTNEIREKTIQNIKDDFDRIDGKPTQKVSLKIHQSYIAYKLLI